MPNSNYLTVTEASARLGVHPNTLRNWEKAGVVRMVRLPGSRHRRVPVGEVVRLETSMRDERCGGGVRLEPPSEDPQLIARARALTEAVKRELAMAEPTETLDEYMSSMRGRSWSP